MENFLELLKNRRSTRVFTEEPVSQEDVCTLMKAALMSPSGHRINPWEFILVEDKEVLAALSVSKEHGAGLLAGAAMAVVVVADTTKTDVWIEDLGLGSCWVQIRRRSDASGVPAEENVKSILAIPENYAVLSIVGVGHKARETKPFDEDKMQWEKIHIGSFGGK